MKKGISGFQLGLTFAGCFLGAGYVSGREMWQFFGRFGMWGWIGLAMAMSCLGLFGGMTLLLVQKTDNEVLEELVIPWNIPTLRICVSVFSVVFLFGIDSIMTAGSGAMYYQLFGFPKVWGSFLFSLIVAGVTLSGKEGMVSVFSLIVPFLTIAAVVLSMLALITLPKDPVVLKENGMEWIFSSITFAAYNMFSTVAILAPLGKDVTVKKVKQGILFGTSILFLIAGLIIIVLSKHSQSVLLELPMLSVVSQITPGLGYFFGILLLAAMFGTGLSSFLTGVNQLINYSSVIRRNRVTSIVILSLLIFAASMCGFGKLINVFYPIFGSCSIVFLICLFIHFYKVSVNKHIC